MHLLPHLAARVLGTPLLIHPHKLDVIVSVLSHRIGIAVPKNVDPHAGMADMPPSDETGNAYRVGGIAVIPVTGSLMNRALGLDAASGLTSYGDIGSSFDAALADPDVDGIVFDIDSPGGEAGGAFDLADQIYSARQTKPVWAVANDQAFSAAYAIASSCERLFVTRTGGVGSIGVIALHIDQSQKDAQDGYRYTPVYAGGHKNDFSPHAPLSPGAQLALQSEVERLHNLFAATVARNRGIPVEAVLGTEAGLFFCENALAAHLADAVGTLMDAVSQMSGLVRTQRVLTQARTGNTPNTPFFTTHQEHVIMETPTPATPENGAVMTPPAVNPAAVAAAVNPTATSAANPTVHAAAIADLCLLAGMPERTAGLLHRGVTIDNARRELLAAKASAHAEEIHSRLAPASTGAAASSPTSLDNNPVVKAAQARAAAARAAT